MGKSLCKPILAILLMISGIFLNSSNAYAIYTYQCSNCYACGVTIGTPIPPGWCNTSDQSSGTVSCSLCSGAAPDCYADSSNIVPSYCSAPVPTPTPTPLPSPGSSPVGSNCDPAIAATVCYNLSFADTCGNPGACYGTAVGACSGAPSPSPGSSPTPSPPPPGSPSPAPKPFVQFCSSGNHWGIFEFGISQAHIPGVSTVDQGYTNAINVTDGNLATAATAIGVGTHRYYACVWTFPSWSSSTPMYLNVYSEVAFNNEYGNPITDRSSSISYSFNNGATWTTIYDTFPRAKTWDNVVIPANQNLNAIQVEAFTDSHDDMSHYVYEISVTPSPAP